MELRQLRYFLAVAEALNFTRAAERLGIAQPPLSHQIKRLEDEWGVQLFVRSNRNVTLTAAGVALVSHAERMLGMVRRTKEDVCATQRGEHGSVAIGASYTSICTLAPLVLQVFIEQFPDVRIHVHEMSVDKQVAALRAGAIDVGLTGDLYDDPELTVHTLYTEPYVAALACDNPLAQAVAVPAPDFLRQPFIAIAPTNYNRFYRANIEAIFTLAQLEPVVALEVGDIHTQIALVGAGLGVALVPASMQGMALATVAYRPLSVRTPRISSNLVWRRDSNSAIIRNFLSAAQAAVEQVEKDPKFGIERR